MEMNSPNPKPNSCLNNASRDSDDVVEALIVVSVDPVEDVEQFVAS